MNKQIDVASTQTKQNCDAAVLKHDHREGKRSVQRRIKQTKVELLPCRRYSKPVGMASATRRCWNEGLVTRVLALDFR